MERADRFGVCEHHDHPLDLTPPAVMDDVAAVAARIGARCGLEPGIFAEARHQLMRVRNRRPVGQKRKIRQAIGPRIARDTQLSCQYRGVGITGGLQ